MYAYFKGILVQKAPGHIVIETSGIGYNIFFPEGRMDYLPSVGDETVVYTYTFLTQDALSLYGFPTWDELDLFKLLITVSGVGPKAGMALLSVLSPEQVGTAIISGDAKTLSKAKGVSSKTAERLIVDLRNKIDPGKYIPGGSSVSVPEETVMDNGAAQDTCDALMAIGYSKREAMQAVSKALQAVGNEADSDVLIKAALKYMKQP
ncbi:MAG: Holliday junction branch migration protein RuvA [Lachnospiraceae bacterium]|nr:Holliday junction branch migration protein RuvA [Lachnospiraceae bacterium]